VARLCERLSARWDRWFLNGGLEFCTMLWFAGSFPIDVALERWWHVGVDVVAVLLFSMSYIGKAWDWRRRNR
jgi:hypothetical protein